MATIADGQEVQVPGKKYVMKNVAGTYSCTCMAWRNQSRGVDRTCKHLVAYLGARHEFTRLGWDAMPTAWKKQNPKTGRSPIPVNSSAKSSINGSAKRPSKAKSAIAESDSPVLLADTWVPGMDPTGYLMSEKLDGVRAYWNGTEFRSREGNIFWAPPEFTQGFPDHPLDGELFLDRGEFQKTISIVRTQNRDTYERWKVLSYRVFDAPNHPGKFEDRIAYCEQICGPLLHATVVIHEICQNLSHLESELDKVESLGGEGLMLRQSNSDYIPGRNSTLLKVKRWFDAECAITGYTKGKGRHKGVVGAFECVQMDDMTVSVGSKSVTVRAGTVFKINATTDAQRRNPPDVGSVVSYKFLELTKAGIPRNATIIGVRDYE